MRSREAAILLSEKGVINKEKKMSRINFAYWIEIK